MGLVIISEAILLIEHVNLELQSTWDNYLGLTKGTIGDAKLFPTIAG